MSTKYHQLEYTEDGLACCPICNGAEGSLTTHCIGEKLNSAMEDNVLNESWDYVHGKWMRPAEDHEIKEAELGSSEKSKISNTPVAEALKHVKFNTPKGR